MGTIATFDHAEYRRLEDAARKAEIACAAARRRADRRNASPATIAAYHAAVEISRAASKARFDYEMFGTTLVDLSALTGAEWAAALGYR